MIKRLLQFALLLIVVAQPQLLCAQDAKAFKPQAANKTLDRLSIKLSIENLNIRHLESAVSELVDLRYKAKDCTDNTKAELDQVSKLLAEVLTTDPEPQKLGADKAFLQKKQTELSARLSDCRLFVLRSSEAIDAFSATLQKMVTSRLLQVEAHLWGNITNTIQAPEKIAKSYNPKTFLKYSGATLLTKTTTALFILLIIAAAAGGIRLRKYISNFIKPEPAEIFAEQLMQAMLTVMRIKVLQLVILIAITLFTAIISLRSETLPMITSISFGSLVYMVSLIFIRIIFYPPEPGRGISNLSVDVAKSLFTRTKLLARLALAGFVIYELFQHQPFPQPIIHLARTLFVTLFAINLIGIVWLLNRIPKLLYGHPTLRLSLSIVLSVGLVTILVGEWSGYHNLSSYFVGSIAGTLAIVFLAWFVHIVVGAIFDSIAGSQQSWQQHLRYHLGIKKHQAIPELIWLRFVLIMVLGAGFIILLLRNWGLSDANYVAITEGLIDGFHIAGLYIIPSRILIAIALFSGLVSVIRLMKTRLTKRTGIQMERGAREALSAVVGYVGFAGALLFALLFAGVNFAGLAIIAGALSVGIGFGLQNIANNIVSGIILLIERPIKTGDRIIVGQTDGYVKKISIRSTQIQTLNRSDVIVPNSEIICSQVTNLMFRDLYGRISIFVGVAYGSDLDLVKSVLTDLASEHPETVNDESVSNPVTVLFNKFGDSSLDFELRCIIRDIDKQFIVKSELHFAVDKAFREHHIEIPFPQRDIHIKNGDLATATD